MKFNKTLILSVIVLAGTPALASLPAESQAFLDKYSSKISKLYVSGGTSSVDDSPVDAAKAAADLTKSESAVKLASVNGTIKITKKDGTTVNFVSDGKTPPPALNDGDQVTVVSGDATLSVGGTTASLKAGDTVGVSGRSMNVVAGTVSFTNAKGTTTAKAGETVTVPAPASVPSTTGGTTSGTDSSKTAGSAQQEQDAASPSAP